MQQSLTNEMLETLKGMKYLVGSADVILSMPNLPVKECFSEDIIEFMADLSKKIMKDREAKAYPDVVTLGFWLRKSSILQLKDCYEKKDNNIHVGRGIVFHIAPSNVAVNYAYSLMSGLLMGNANIVRLPSKEFPQVYIINRLIDETLVQHSSVQPYIALVKYGRNKDINDVLSGLSDVRVIWGGDQTINEIRKSPLKPRATEITFADRYSLSIIDSDYYLKCEDKDSIAEKFYNDTYLSDQNACTSPRIIIWTGTEIVNSKYLFWDELYTIVSKKYQFQDIMGVNKLTSSYLAAVTIPGVKRIKTKDNLIVRLQVPDISDKLMELRDNSGYFFEYDCNDIMELRPLCDDSHIQTIGMIGDSQLIVELIKSGIRGVDRVVPIGSTMDFDLLWDGYDLSERLSRTISLNI